MPNYQDTSKKRDKKGKGSHMFSNAQLKDYLKKEGLLNDKEPKKG